VNPEIRTIVDTESAPAPAETKESLVSAAEFDAPRNEISVAGANDGDRRHFQNACVSEIGGRTFASTKRSRIESTGHGPAIVWLDDARAQDPALTGAKAAALARAAGHGLPALPGFVLTTSWADTSEFDPAEVVDAWRHLSTAGLGALVVRSSSVAEDGAGQSMAGLFTSVLDVRGLDAFNDAVDDVLASRLTTGLVDAPMAVLVQPFMAPEWGGVLFTADPISGRTDRMVVTAVRGGADAVVGGEAAGWTASLGRHGRALEVRSTDGPALPARIRRRLTTVARRAERVFGGPQDIEWAAGPDGRVVLLQSRPITTLPGPVDGPILGAGPVAETFPDRLGPLEQDLWVRPLAEGLRAALELTASSPATRIRQSPVVSTVDGFPVADLELLGVVPQKRGLIRRLDPRPPARRLIAAWRVGRLKAALPTLIDDVSRQVDDDLAEVPALEALSSRDLLAVLQNATAMLVALHGYEAMAGMFGGGHDTAGTPTGAAMALSALAEARAEGVPRDELVARHPVVLALVPPRVGPPAELPAGSIEPPLSTGAVDQLAVGREVMRLRSRWVQELTARAAWELGARLTAAGVLTRQDDVRLLGLDELVDAVERRIVPASLDERVLASAIDAGSLPTEFRLTADGMPVPVVRPGTGQATGAGGGIGRGRVHQGDDPPNGSVLVVAHLDPRLAPLVPHLGGLVAETGSPLSHLAILAREHGVPTVVGHRGARDEFRSGDLIEVDGTAGVVTGVVEFGRDRPAAEAEAGEAGVLTGTPC
jgi:pyruvate,water dikinase